MERQDSYVNQLNGMLLLENTYLGEYSIQNIIQNAHTYVMKNYAGEKIQKQIEAVYEAFLGGSKK